MRIIFGNLSGSGAAAYVYTAVGSDTDMLPCVPDRDAERDYMQTAETDDKQGGMYTVCSKYVINVDKKVGIL